MTTSLPWNVTAQQVCALHQKVLKLWGGLDGVRDESCPERSIQAALMSAHYRADAEGEEISPVVVAAHLLWFFAKNHCFVDGNKRVAWAASQTVLSGVGLDLEATEDQASAFVIQLIEEKLTVDEVMVWFTIRLRARS